MATTSLERVHSCTENRTSLSPSHYDYDRREAFLSSEGTSQVHEDVKREESFFSLLKVPLLFRACRRDVDTINGAGGVEDTSASVVFCSSPMEFFRGACGSIDEDDSCSGNNDRIGRSDLFSSVSISSRLHSQLRLTHEWTFMSSSFPYFTNVFHAVTTNRMDYFLQILGKVTSHITSFKRREKAKISFFPVELPETIMPSLVEKNRDCIYYEVRSHIPLLLFHADMYAGGDNEAELGCPDTLEGFVGLRRMHAHRLRSLLHDAVMSFMYSAVRIFFPQGCGGVQRREEGFQSTDMGGRDAAEPDSRLRGANIRPVHHFLTFPYALPPPTPIVLGFWVDGCGDHVNAASQLASKEYGDMSALTLTVQTVVCVGCPSADDQLRWEPEIVAYETLANLFSSKFAVHGASLIEVCEIDEGCRVVEKHEFSGAAVAEAWERACYTRGRFLPSSKPLTPHPPSATTEGSLRTQHNPYGTLNGSSVCPEACTLESLSLDGTCIDVNEEENGEDCALYEKSDCSCDDASSLLRAGGGNCDVAADTLADTNLSVTKNAEGMKNADKIKNVEGKEENGQSEEVIELDITGVEEVILSLAKELSESQQQVIGLRQTLQNYISSLLVQHASSDNMNTTSITAKQQRRKKRHDNNKGIDCDSGVLMFFRELFGKLNEHDDGDNVDSLELSLLSNSYSCMCDDDDDLHISFNDCVKGAVNIIQTLRTYLRTLPVVASKSNCDGKALLNGTCSASTSVQRKKDVSTFFAAAIKCLLQENNQQQNTKGKKQIAKADFGVNGAPALLQCTLSVHKKACGSINDVCEKLRAAVAWGRHRVINMRFLCTFWQEVVGPFLELRAICVKEEIKKRSELHVDYVVSTAVLYEKYDAMVNSQEEEEEEEENLDVVNLCDEAEAKNYYNNHNNYEKNNINNNKGTTTTTTTTTNNNNNKNNNKNSNNNNNNNIFADGNHFEDDGEGGGDVNIERIGRNIKNSLGKRTNVMGNNNAQVEITRIKKISAVNKLSKNSKNTKTFLNGLLSTCSFQQHKLFNTQNGGSGGRKKNGMLTEAENRQLPIMQMTISFILLLFGVVTVTVFFT